MELENYTIRKTRREDCPSIRKLIQELAEYEKMPEGPQIDEKTLQEDGFGSRPFFYSFTAEAKGIEGEADSIVGYAIFFYTYSTWQGKSVFMEDIYVQPRHRRKGVGLALFRSVAQAAMLENCTRLNFQVLNWNVSAIEFYKSLGAFDLTQQEGWHSFRLNHQAITLLAGIPRSVSS